jgi:membrane fusion protein, multidrug efflux system
VKRALAHLVLFAAGASGSVARGVPPEDNVFASHLMVDQDVIVSARITGMVESISVDRGTVVTQGQALAMLDTQALDADVREAKEDMDLRKAEYDRAKALVDSKVTSVQDLDSKKAQYAVAVARWEKSKTQRDYAVIRAPFAGVVTEKYAKIGQKVIEDQNDPLFKITATEPLLARVYLPEERLMRVRLGDKVDVVPTRFPDAKTTGEVTFISPSVDAASGTFQVVVKVRRDPGKSVLRPGMAVEVRFPAPSSGAR